MAIQNKKKEAHYIQHYNVIFLILIHDLSLYVIYFILVFERRYPSLWN